MSERIALDDDELVGAALALVATVLLVNGLIFIGAVTAVTTVGRWIRDAR